MICPRWPRTHTLCHTNRLLLTDAHRSATSQRGRARSRWRTGPGLCRHRDLPSARTQMQFAEM